METAKNLTTPEAALKIMGSENFISLDEALKVFPYKKDGLTGYDTVPFSKELLYHCSEEGRPFILFPAFCKLGNVSLTINCLHDLLNYSHYDLFHPFPRDPVMQKSSFIYRATCEPRWYLISKKVMEVDEVKQFCVSNELSYKNFKAAPAVVYVYAWILFKLAKKRTLFLENLLYCQDNYSDRKNAPTMVYLSFKSGKVAAGYWFPKKGGINELGIVPSVDQYTE